MQNSPCGLIKNAFENFQTFTTTVSSEASAYAEAVEKFAVELSHELGSAFETLFPPNQTITNLKKGIIDLKSEVETLTQKISDLEGQVTTLTGEKGSLQDQVTTLRGEKSDLEGQVTTLRGEKSDLESQVAALAEENPQLRTNNRDNRVIAGNNGNGEGEAGDSVGEGAGDNSPSPNDFGDVLKNFFFPKNVKANQNTNS